MRLTIFKKGLILVSVPLLFQLAFIGLIAEMQRENREAQGWFTHTKEVIAQAHAVLEAIGDAETSLGDFIIAGDRAFAEEHERATQRVPEEFAQLRNLVSDNPGQEARMVTLDGKAVALAAWQAETKRLAAGASQSQTAVRERVRAENGLADDLRGGFAVFVREEERLDGLRRLNLERSQRQLQLLLLGGGVAAVLSTGLLAFAFSRGIGRRLATLTENANRLAQSKELVPTLGGSDEIARVDLSFHRMAQELARSEKALREQTQILQSVLDSMADGVVVADRQGKFLLFNPAAEQILGTGPTDAPSGEWAERYGVYLPDQETPFPEGQLPLVRAIRGEKVDAVEQWIRHARLPEGVWISVNARPLRGPDGALRGGVAVFRDVSQAKRAEEAVRRLNEELEQRVLERTRELADANRDLAQKNQENEMFVYSVSHDLRSPLVNLEGFSEELGMVCQDLRGLLADGSLPPAVRERGLALLDGDMAEAVRFIRAGVGRLSNIIDGLLRLSRAGRVEYQCRRVDANAVVAAVVASLRGTVAERGATLTVAELPPLWGDPAAAEQVFANLIGNALNYLDPGRPGVIEVGSAGGAGAEEANGRRALLTYYVKDNGLGIPASYRPKVFQLFQRLHPGVAKGEGIGLTLVRRLVERLGGRIWLESTEGVGSTFFVALPAPPADEPSFDTPPNGGALTEQECADGSAATCDCVS